MNSKEENYEDFCRNYVQEFGLGFHPATPFAKSTVKLTTLKFDLYTDKKENEIFLIQYMWKFSWDRSQTQI